MIKKNLVLLIFALQFACLFAVWEGNGGVGSVEEFPNGGLFVRSDMFPKHTLLEITNLEKNITARAVVTGSSGIQGLLISVSPELALKLSIPSGKVVRVRILTPSPVQEFGDDGIGLTTGSIESKDLDSNPALFSAAESSLESDNTDDDNIDAEKIITEAASIPVESSEPPQVATENTELTPVEIPADNVDNTSLANVENDVKPKEVQSESQVKKAENENDELIFYDNTVAETETRNIVTPDINHESVKPVENKFIPVTNTEPTPIPDTKPSPDPAPVVPQIKSVVYMEPTDMRPPVSVGSIIKPAPQSIPEKPVNEIGKPLEPPALSEPPQEKVNNIAAATPPANADKSEFDFSVSTIPSIQKPEIHEEDDNKEPIDIPQIAEAAKNEEIYESEEAANELAVTIENVPQKPEKENDIPDEPAVVKTEEYVETKNVSDNKSKLEKGRLYIQIAGYKDFGTADSVVKKYGNMYPVFIEEKKYKEESRFVVFIGPLQKEEIGAVIERFKKLGFSGAFLKRDMIKTDF